MDARPLLETLGRALNQAGLEAIPLVPARFTLRYSFRKTPANLRKLNLVAKELGAVIFRPYFPAADVYCLMRDEDGLRVDFFPGQGEQILPPSPQRGAFSESNKRVTRKQRLAALKAESDRSLVDMIRRLLDKPMQERTHFLRKRISYRGSCL